MPFSYRLPFLRDEVGVADPLWGREIPFSAEQRTHERPEVHIARLRQYAKEHPDSRARVATYLRILRRLGPHLREREQEEAGASRTAELAFEYTLPHLAANRLPAGLPDPLHGSMKDSSAMYTMGQEQTRKAPHVHIAELRSWAAAHPQGRAVADEYIRLFERNAERLYAADRSQRATETQREFDRIELRIADSVLLRDAERRQRGLESAAAPGSGWEERGHDARWVRANLPHVDRLAVTSVSNPSMPAFAKLVRGSRADERLPLAGFRILGLQHLLGNTGSFIRALSMAGVRPEDSAYMGKVYSQHGPVLAELRALGFDMREAQFESEMDVQFGYGGAPSQGAKGNRRVELDHMVAGLVRAQDRPHHRNDEPTRLVDRKHKYLVVDDGGELIEHIHRHYPELHDRVVAVEQTRKGIRRLQRLGLRFPVINMAEAVTKLQLESPMIGLALAHSTTRRLERLQEHGVPVGKRLLLVGYGDIGARAAAALKVAGYEVAVIDSDEAAQRRAAEAGYTVYGAPPKGISALQHALSQSEVVLSTTGTTAITPADLEHAPSGTVFLNGASSATEFMPYAEDLTRHASWPRQEGSQLVTTVSGRRFVMGMVQPGGDPQLDWVLRTRSGKEHILVGRGQVINFDNGPGVLPPRYAQLIVGLLYMSSLQAAAATAPGIQALAAAPQVEYARDVQADLARTGESLERPRF